MRIVLDAGALIGIERSDRRVAGLIELGRRAGAGLITVAPVLGQVWRSGARQAGLARALPMIDIKTTMVADAKSAGALLGLTRTSDVVDALLVEQVLPGDQVLTSDPVDLAQLLDARGIPAAIVKV
jgi:hypothetical protein